MNFTPEQLALVMHEIRETHAAQKRLGETLDRIMALLNSIPITVAELKARLEKLEADR